MGGPFRCHNLYIRPYIRPYIRVMPLRITDQITLQDWEMTESFTRASGPGGQNVNKVSSAVELRFEAERSPNLPDPVKRRLRRLAGRRWTKEGAVVIQVSEERVPGPQPGDRAGEAGGAGEAGDGGAEEAPTDEADEGVGGAADQGEEGAGGGEGVAGEGGGVRQHVMSVKTYCDHSAMD
jgi:hypothetical protein